MCELSIRGYSMQGSILDFHNVRTFRFQSDRFTPADQFSFEALDSVGNWHITRIEVRLGTSLLFSGMVDTQTTTLDETGHRTSFSCRSCTAELLDNEVQPMVYRVFSTLDLLDRHGYPYGITGHRLNKNCTFRSISASKGMSHWEFICYFCHRAYGCTPFLDRNGNLTLIPAEGQAHRFCNQGGIPYTKVVLREDRYQMLSTLYVKTGEDDDGTLYNHRAENGIAQSLGIRRERYYHPSTLWEDDIRLSARHVMKEAQLDYREIAVTVPRLLDARVGELAVLDDPQFREKQLYVAQVVHNGEEKGVHTLLRLWDRTVL